MIRGLYTATTGMRVQQIKQEKTSENINNLETPGYKRKTVTSKTFPEHLMSLRGSNDVIGSIGTGVMATKDYYHMDPGLVKKTNRDYDLAIDGDGFFEVVNDEGQVFYTRGGSFSLDDEGYLVNNEGYRVRDDQGNYIRPQGEFNVSSNGILQGTGQRIAVVSFDDVSELNQIGSGLWTVGEDSNVKLAETSVKQGFLELSNVDLAQETTDMIVALRAYQFNTKVFSAIDKTLDRAVNEIGKL